MTVAQIDLAEAYKHVSAINDNLKTIDEGCKKLLVVLDEASEGTNLKSVVSIHKAFEEVSTTMSALSENMENVCEATKKYADEVADIDAEDNTIFE